MPIDVPVRRDGCPFCRNIAGVASPTSGLPDVVHEDEHTYVFVNPASLGGVPGHLLVIPRRHVELVFDLSDDEVVALARSVKRAAVALQAALDPDGITIQQRNGAAAEQTVPHVHFHVVPRRAGIPFPPVEWIERMPLDERRATAEVIRAAWV